MGACACKSGCHNCKDTFGEVELIPFRLSELDLSEQPSLQLFEGSTSFDANDGRGFRVQHGGRTPSEELMQLEKGQEEALQQAADWAELQSGSGGFMPSNLDEVYHLLQSLHSDETSRLYDPMTGQLECAINKGFTGIADFAIASMPTSDMDVFEDVLLLCLEERISFYDVWQHTWQGLWLYVWGAHQIRAVREEGKQLLVLTDDTGQVGFKQTIGINFLRANYLPFEVMAASSLLRQLRPLVQAAKSGDWMVCDRLLDRADSMKLLNQARCGGLTATHIFACTADASPCLERAVLRVGACQRTYKGFTPLHLAAQHNQVAVVATLLAGFADIEARNSRGESPAFIAALNGHVELLRHLAQRHADLDSQTRTGASPAFAAAQRGHVDVLRLLAARNADLDEQTIEGASPALVAALGGHAQVLLLLAQHRADPLAQDSEGFSPTFVAAEQGHLEVLKLLAQRRADLNSRTADGFAPALVAAQLSRCEVLSLLGKQRADLDAQSHDGSSPAFVAAQNGHVEALRLLLGQRADLERKSCEGASPALVATNFGHVEVLQALGHWGLDLGAEGGKGWYEGRTPASLAEQLGHTEILQVIENWRPGEIFRTLQQWRPGEIPNPLKPRMMLSL